MSVFVKLYYLMIHMDNMVNEKELSIGKLMVSLEGFSESEFYACLEKMSIGDANLLYHEFLKDLHKLKRIQQIRCIAWMCVIANADGFMDKSEWQFIYKIYHKELQIPLDEIMKVQNELIRLTHVAKPSPVTQVQRRA